MRKELLKGLTDEQIKKVEACKNPEEILALAKSEGVDLNDEQLEAVTGGGCFFDTLSCPNCRSTNVKKYADYGYYEGKTRYEYKCGDCGHHWYTMND